jgi:hypothetical protein
MQLVKAVTETGAVAMQAMPNPRHLPAAVVAGERGRAVLLGEVGLARLAIKLKESGFTANNATVTDSRLNILRDEAAIDRIVAVVNSQNDLSSIFEVLDDEHLLALSFLQQGPRPAQIRVTRDGAISMRSENPEVLNLVVHSVDDFGID